jgi:hypothetical protein
VLPPHSSIKARVFSPEPRGLRSGSLSMKASTASRVSLSFAFLTMRTNQSRKYFSSELARRYREFRGNAEIVLLKDLGADRANSRGHDGPELYESAALLTFLLAD